MFDDLAAIFYDNVVPAFDDYVDRRHGHTAGRNRHLRAALTAASALFHFLDHVKPRLDRAVEAGCHDFRLVADVANVTKHKTINRLTPAGPPLVASAENVREVAIVTRYEDSEGEYSDTRTSVLVTCTDGAYRNLDVALVNVFNYWADRLKQWGVADYPQIPLPALPGTQFVPRRDAENFDIDILKVMRFRQHIQLLNFDNATGVSRPIDLTNAELEWHVYKPAFTLDIVVTPSAGAGPIKCSLELDDEQSAVWHDLKIEKQRKDFLKALLKDRREEVQLRLNEALKARAA